MCRKEKKPKDEIISRLKTKYIDIISGKYDRDVVKIAFFTQYVIEQLSEPELMPNTNQKV